MKLNRRCLAFLVTALLWAEQPYAAETGASVDVTVMSFNIEWGGENISFDNVVTAIRKSGASIVGIQEAEGNLRRLADALGWKYDLRNYVISSFPLIDPPGADGKYVLAEIRPGQVVAIANVHLPSDPYGPDAVRDGATPEEVLELERVTRLPEVRPYLRVLAPLVERNFPVFLTGDFNAPAHTDWTEDTVGERLFLRYALGWPVSQAVTAAGFHDSWRVVHPDPVSHPGLTWWAGRPPLEAYTPGENDAQDRIDFVWYSGSVKARSARIVGEEGRSEVSVSVMPWPSDHRAVVSDFTVVPATMPEVLSTSRRVYTHGDDIDAIYNFPPGQSRVISVANAETGERVFARKLVGANSVLRLPTELFVYGSYRVRMADPDGGASLDRDFWVLAPDAVPAVRITHTTIEKGEAIGISWRNAPGNRNDYVAVYRAGVTPASENILAWAYVDATPNGQMLLDMSGRRNAPLEPGRYVVRLMMDDGYEPLAASQLFTVRSCSLGG